MAETARNSNLPILGRNFDLNIWFRQLTSSMLERWKTFFYIEGGFREDQRMQMGRNSSAQHGQRVTFLLAEILQQIAIEEGWGMIGTTKGEAETEANDALRVLPFQYELTVVVIGWKNAKTLIDYSGEQ